MQDSGCVMHVRARSCGRVWSLARSFPSSPVLYVKEPKYKAQIGQVVNLTYDIDFAILAGNGGAN